MSNHTTTAASSQLHFAVTYIVLPWIAGVLGPDSYDCWGLFLALQREVGLGVDAV